MHNRFFLAPRGGFYYLLVILCFLVTPLLCLAEPNTENQPENYYRFPLHLVSVSQVSETPTETPTLPPDESPAETPTVPPSPPTNTPVPPTESPIPIPPTETPTQVPPTETPTPIPPTFTPVPPTESPTPIPEPTESPTEVPVEPLQLSIGEASGNVGEEIVVSIQIENADEVDAFGFDVLQSEALLEFVAVEVSDTLTADFFNVNGSAIEGQPGVVRIAAIGGFESLSGEGELVKLRYSATAAGETTLTFANILDDLAEAETTGNVVIVSTVETPTEIPPTEVPPTEVPPTEVPPTETATPVPPTPESPTPTPATPVPQPTDTPLPTDTPTATPTPTPSDFDNPFQGISLLTGFGGIHDLGDIVGWFDTNNDGTLEPNTSHILPFFEEDVYRDLELFIENEGTAGAEITAVLACTGDGRVFSARTKSLRRGKYIESNYIADFPLDFDTNDALRDVAFTDNANGYFALLSDGSVYSVVGKGNARQINPINSVFTNPRANPAIDLEIIPGSGNPGNPSGYILDSFGRIYRLGNAPALSGNPVFQVKLYKDMELYFDDEGELLGAILVDGFGKFYKATKSGVAPEELNIILPELAFGDNFAMQAFSIQVDRLEIEGRDEALLEQFNRRGIFAITRFGSIHTSGAADFFLESERANVDQTADGQLFINPGFAFDIARDIEVYIYMENQ